MGAKQAMQQEMTGASEGKPGHRRISMTRKGGVHAMRKPAMSPSTQVSPTEERPPADPNQPT